MQSDITEYGQMAGAAEPDRNPPTWRAWALLTILLLPVFMLAMDMSVMFLAIPSIAPISIHLRRNSSGPFMSAT